jgi:putative polyhydroxyalkanoate system protein
MDLYRREKTMRIAVPHNTSKEAARTKITERVKHLLNQFGDKADDISHEWAGDTMKFRGKARGMTVEGTVEVTDADVVIDGKLPLLAKPFESRIKHTIERETESMFGKA